MRLRPMAGAFIINGNEYLMMKRGVSRKLAPGMWAPVGGHLEPHEFQNPRDACLREIFEESGLEEKDFNKLDLKYILLRREKEEIRIHYIFIALTDNKQYMDKTDEGKLFWVREEELFDREMSFTIRKALEHYIDTGYKDISVMVGTVSAEANKPRMNWNLVDHWDGMMGN